MNQTVATPLCRWNRRRPWDSTGFLNTYPSASREASRPQFLSVSTNPNEVLCGHPRIPSFPPAWPFKNSQLSFQFSCNSVAPTKLGNVVTKPHLQQLVTNMLASCSVMLRTCEVQGCMNLESHGESMVEFSRPCKDKAGTRHYATPKAKAFTTNLYRNSFLACVPMSKFKHVAQYPVSKTGYLTAYRRYEKLDNRWSFWTCNKQKLIQHWMLENLRCFWQSSSVLQASLQPWFWDTGYILCTGYAATSRITKNAAWNCKGSYLELLHVINCSVFNTHTKFLLYRSMMFSL